MRSVGLRFAGIRGDIKPYKFIGFGAMDVTKPYKFYRVWGHVCHQTYTFIGFGAMDVTKPYQFIVFVAMCVTKPYKFTGFGAMDVTTPYKFIGGPRMSSNRMNLYGLGP